MEQNPIISINNLDWLNIKSQYPTDEEIEDIVRIARVMDIVKEVPTDCGHKCYLISLTDTEYLFLIPSDVIVLMDSRITGTETREEMCQNPLFKDKLRDGQGTLRVLGGAGVVTAVAAFQNIYAKTIDLSRMNTSYIKNMCYMFNSCMVERLVLGDINTSLVENMYGMFSCFWTKTLDLSCFDTSNVKDMRNMFNSCRADNIILNGVKAGKETKIKGIFKQCRLNIIGLGETNQRNLRLMMHIERARQLLLKPLSLVRKR